MASLAEVSLLSYTATTVVKLKQSAPTGEHLNMLSKRQANAFDFIKSLTVLANAADSIVFLRSWQNYPLLK